MRNGIAGDVRGGTERKPLRSASPADYQTTPTPDGPSGTGQAQSIKDALADAETLWLVLPDDAISSVMWNVWSAYDFMRNPNPAAIAHVYTYARWAASAAFRAVPALREVA